MKKLFIIIILFSVVQAKGIRDRVEDEIRTQFSNSQIDLSNFKISIKIKNSIEKAARQKFFNNRIFYWEIFTENKLNAIALLDNVYGKTMPITFMVIFDLNGNIISSRIIKYREAHGGEIDNENWLNQFTNKNANSTFEFGKDIDGISGATISAKSVTKGIEKLALLAKIILGVK